MAGDRQRNRRPEAGGGGATLRVGVGSGGGGTANESAGRAATQSNGRLGESGTQTQRGKNDHNGPRARCFSPPLSLSQPHSALCRCWVSECTRWRHVGQLPRRALFEPAWLAGVPAPASAVSRPAPLGLPRGRMVWLTEMDDQPPPTSDTRHTATAMRWMASVRWLSPARQTDRQTRSFHSAHSDARHAIHPTAPGADRRHHCNSAKLDHTLQATSAPSADQ